MRIGLISDTHISAAIPSLPAEVDRAFAGVDLILHTGDIYLRSALEHLETMAPLYAVFGGRHDRAIDHPRIDDRHVLRLEGITLGMTHALDLAPLLSEVWPGVIAREFPRGASVRDAVGAFFGRPVDIVAFGDTHEALCERHEGILFVNAGSPTLPRHERRLGTVAIIDIAGGDADARVIDLRGLAAP